MKTTDPAKQTVPEEQAPIPDQSEKLESKKPELTPEAIAERQFLTGMLIHQTDDVAKQDRQRKKAISEELIELRSGVKISLEQLRQFVTAARQPYEPRFPNDIPFFKEIYRLNAWIDKDPKAYSKPSIVGAWINEIIYGRFTKDVLPALQALNPALPNGLRAHKLFQHLNEDGQQKVIDYRDDAIAVMKDCTTWYEFRKKMFEQYKIPYQIQLFEHRS